MIKSQTSYSYNATRNTYNCYNDGQCIIDCQRRNCSNIYVDSLEAISLKIIGCTNNCNNMTIQCPQNLTNLYECQIKPNVSTNSSIYNLHVYAQSLDEIEIDFNCIVNSIFYSYPAANSTCLISMDGFSCSNDSHSEQDSICYTFNPTATIPTYSPTTFPTSG